MTTADTILTAIDGNKLRVFSTGEEGPVYLTVRRAIVEALVGGKQDVSAEEKLRRYTLAQLTFTQDLSKLREDEVELIKKLAGDALSIQAFGALMEALKGIEREC